MLESATSVRSTLKVKSLPTQHLLHANKQQPANLPMSKLKTSPNNRLLEKTKALKLLRLLKVVHLKSQSLLSQNARVEVVKAKKHSQSKLRLLSKKKDQHKSEAKLEVQLQSQLWSHLHIS